MKNSYIILINALLFASPGFSQPTLNKSCGFQDGSLVQLYVDITPSLGEGNSGEEKQNLLRSDFRSTSGAPTTPEGQSDRG